MICSSVDVVGTVAPPALRSPAAPTSMEHAIVSPRDIATDFHSHHHHRAYNDHERVGEQFQDDDDDKDKAEQDATRRFELKLLQSSDDLLLHSVRSSVSVMSGAASVGERSHKRDHTAVVVTSSSASFPSESESPSASKRRPKSRLEQKLKWIAQYIKTMSSGLALKHHPSAHTASSAAASVIVAAPALPATTQQQLPLQSKSSQHRVLVMRKSQVSLSQHLLPRSAPDVLRTSTTISRNSSRTSNSHAAPRVSSSSSHKTSLSWDEICADAVRVVEVDSDMEETEENEPVMSPSPSPRSSRKRGRSTNDLFDHAELQRICCQCDVPVANQELVIQMIVNDFGTCRLDLTILHNLINGNSIVLIGMLVFTCIDNDGELLDLDALPSFLAHIQNKYTDRNPFHNACHAADVLHSLFMMVWTTQLHTKIAFHNQIGVLFAAIMHDIEHIGLTNDFLVKTNHEIAQKYISRAPMEEMHTAVALALLNDPQVHVLAKMTPSQREEVFLIVQETIRSTALCFQKDLLQDVAQISATQQWANSIAGVLPLQVQLVALRCAMHVSDISQTMKPFAIHSTWVARLNEELFLQGDLDHELGVEAAVSPAFCYRKTWTKDAFLHSQVWFLTNMALPAARAFNSIPWIHAMVLEENLENNISLWQAQLSSSSSSSPIG